MKIKGIVLSSYDYAEYDKIVKILSYEKGIITIFANGVCKLKSKNKFSLGILSVSEFEIFWKTKGISKLKRGILIKSGYLISQNYYGYLLVIMILEIIDQTTFTNDNHMQIYTFLEETLLKWDWDSLKQKIAFIAYKCLEYNGSKFDLNNCYYCHTKNNIKAFLYDKNAFICWYCLNQRKINKKKYNDNIEFLKLIYNWNSIDNLTTAIEFSTKVHYKVIDDFFNFIILFYKNSLGFYINSIQELHKSNLIEYNF